MRRQILVRVHGDESAARTRFGITVAVGEPSGCPVLPDLYHVLPVDELAGRFLHGVVVQISLRDQSCQIHDGVLTAYLPQ